MLTMSRLHIAVFVLLITCASVAQERKIPVSVSRTGEDEVGSHFVAAFDRQLSLSSRYEPTPTKGIDKGLRFYIELMTVDLAGDGQEPGKRSAVSVVIEDMGLPNSYPVSEKWYHKVVVVDQKTADKIAKELIEDLDARWCSYL